MRAYLHIVLVAFLLTVTLIMIGISCGLLQVQLPADPYSKIHAAGK